MGKKKRPQGLEVQQIETNEGTQMNTTTNDEQSALLEGGQQQAEGAKTTPDEQSTTDEAQQTTDSVETAESDGPSANDVAPLDEAQQTMQEEQETSQQATEYDAEHPEPEGEQQEAQPVAKVGFGIGQFARWMLLNTTKTNAEILALTLEVFPDANTTAACIAWYKSDLRKKKLLPSVSGRSKGNVVEFSEDELKALLK